MKKTMLGMFLSVIGGLVITGCTTSLPDIKNHNACFLASGASVRMMNILSTKLPYDSFKAYVKQQKDMGADFVYLYTIDEKDGGWTPFSFYVNNDIGGAVDKNIVSEYQKRMEYVREQDMGVILWLRADDSPNFNKTSYDKQVAYQKHVVEYFDEYTSAYIVGLEADEYMNSGTAEKYASELQKLTDKHIGIHLTVGRYDYALNPSVDGLWLQYGFNKTASQVESTTKSVIGKMGGKPVYGVEYHMSSETEQAKTLGDAAMKGGAQGTGNNRHK